MSRSNVIHAPIITGLGLATPLGSTLKATWESLCAGQSIVDHSRVPLHGPDGARVNLLARHVAREAIEDAGWNPEQLRRAAILVGTSKGAVDAWLESGRITCDLAFGLADTATILAREMEILGPRLTLSAACASGLHALIRAAIMIQSGEISRVLVVAAESSLHPLFIGSFERLGVIPPSGYGCRPFDENRAGFVISEAAAAICLEAGVSKDLRYPKIDRFALAADATHLTAGDPNGATLKRVLGQVADRSEIELIHAHGTGTLANDPVELAAIESTLVKSEIRPTLYSHKGALGHSLGAAGLVATVINCLSHRDSIVPPNVHTRRRLKSKAVEIWNECQPRPIQNSIALAAGFGGAIAAVRLAST